MDIYDEFGAALYDASTDGFDNEIEFFLKEAEKSGSPILELGCGTGRILIPIAEAGFEIVGLDSAPHMLRIAEEKLNGIEPEVRNRIRLVEGDMRSFSLEQRFNLIIIPFRAFQHVLTSKEQQQSLDCIREHLEDDGRLIIDTFDPKLDLLTAHTGLLGNAVKKYKEFNHPGSGNRVVAWESRSIDLAEQIISEEWIFEEFDKDGSSVSRKSTSFQIRYIFRWEMMYLLELCGFSFEALYGDFKRGAFRHGGEQIWVVTKK